MLKKFAVITSISLFATAACVNSPASANSSNGNSNGIVNSISSNGNQENKSVSDDANAKSSNVRTFLGYLDANRVEINLTRDADNLSGTYQYEKIGKDLKLAGTIDKSGNFILQETDPAGKKTGEWKGSWKEADGRATLTGKWKSGKGGKDLDFSADELKTEFAGGAKIKTKFTNESDKAKFYDISAEYPELLGVDAATAANFNRSAKKIADDNNSDFKKSLAEITTPEDLKRYKEMGISLSDDVTYDLEMANDEAISVIFTDASFEGGAHGSATTTTLNFDLKNNRVLKLADIFEPSSNYLKTIADLSVADLKAKLQKDQMLDDDMLKEGTVPTEDNFKSWNLTNKGLMITFDPYQVAAYAAGPQEVVIPYSKLQSILRKDSIVNRISK